MLTSWKNCVMLKPVMPGLNLRPRYRIDHFEVSISLSLILIPGGLLGISSDGDDRRILFGLKFSIPGFFCLRKFGKYFLG